MIVQFTPWRRRELQAYLNLHERSAAAMYGNLLTSGLVNIPTRLRCGDYFGVRNDDGGELKGVLGLYNDGNLMVYTQELWDQQVFELAALSPWHSLWDFSGQPGVPMLMEELPGVRNVRRLLLMERDGGVPLPSLPEGLRVDYVNIHNPTRSEVDFVGACMRQCFGFRSDPAVLRHRMRERSPQEQYHILTQTNERAAQAHIQAWTPHYAIVGGVACLPPYRGHGLATAVTASLCRYIEQNNHIPILTVDDDNPSALSVYEKLGFKRLETFYVCHRS